MDQYTPWARLKRARKNRLEATNTDCGFEAPVIDYLQRDSVRTSLHIPADTPQWEFCNSSDAFSYTESRNGSLWVYRELRGKYKILKFSGDSDGVVPTYGTQ